MMTERHSKPLAICGLRLLMADFIRPAMIQSLRVTKARMSRKRPDVL